MDDGHDDDDDDGREGRDDASCPLSSLDGKKETRSCDAAQIEAKGAL